MTWIFVFFTGIGFLFFDFSYLYCFFVGVLMFLVSSWGGFWFGGVFFMDSLSFFLVFLSILVFLFCAISSALDLWGSNYFGAFFICLSSIFFFLLFSFSCFSYLVFYMSFEFIFLLMFIFVYGWGYSPERMGAAFYMVFYTLVVSFPFLVFLVGYSYYSFDSGKFVFLNSWSSYWWASLILVFLVKLPVYGVHLWLPKAHVEAPVSGSMVLAGVLLKLGTYGALRFSILILGSLSSLKGYLVSIGLLGGLLSCFLCLRQSDLKAFVAYSSVCHMGFGLGGLYSGNELGLTGSVFMMIGHGFCSSCLFYILYVFYERFFTRSGLVLKGIGHLYPMMLLIWFSFSVLNMGVPPSFSFFSEILILSGLGSLSVHTFFFSGVLLLFAGIYGIFLYVISCHSAGILAGYGHSFSMREFLNFFGHGFFMLFFIFSTEFFYL